MSTCWAMTFWSRRCSSLGKRHGGCICLTGAGETIGLAMSMPDRDGWRSLHPSITSPFSSGTGRRLICPRRVSYLTRGSTSRTLISMLRIGDVAPDWTLITADGQPLTLSEFWGGERTALLVFLRHLG